MAPFEDLVLVGCGELIGVVSLHVVLVSELMCDFFEAELSTADERLRLRPP